MAQDSHSGKRKSKGDKKAKRRHSPYKKGGRNRTVKFKKDGEKSKN